MRKNCFRLFVLALNLFSTAATAQNREHWIMKPQVEWPRIAMVNEVWYKNGDRYVHPSFQYAATGFLIDTGKDTLAATAKHVLWIAKTKNMKSVDLKDNLQKWVMHPKGNLADSVVIEQLINTDSTEILEGKSSTITQRDWLVFSTKFRSPQIQPLKPRFTPVGKGEKVYIFACPYQEKNCVIYTGNLIESVGNRLIISRDTSQQVGGASGSAVVDQNGFLVGILGGASTDRKTGAPAFYGISTHYLQSVLQKTPALNQPLTPIDQYLRPIIKEQGIRLTVKQFKKIYKQPESYFEYDFSSEQLNKLGVELKEANQLGDAIAIFKLSLMTFPWLYTTYNLLGEAYEKSEKKKLARKAFEKSIELYPEDKAAQDALKRL